MNNELIPGKLYELLENVDVMTNDANYRVYMKIKRGNIILWLSNGPNICHTFLHENNASCLHWLCNYSRLSEIFKLVV